MDTPKICAFMNRECNTECAARVSVTSGNDAEGYHFSFISVRLDSMYDIAAALTHIKELLPTLVNDNDSIADAISSLAESTQNIAAMIDAKILDSRDDPSGHKPRIKGGVGPNLFKRAEDGSLADDPINGPQFFKATGEVRGIEKGEWFISGAIPEAYQSVATDSLGKYHIAVPTTGPQKIIVLGGLTYKLVLRHE